METAPGERGQVEGGPFGTSLHQGQRCPLYGLVMGLGDSRALFAHCTTTPRLATFRGGHLRAVEAFGGDPRARLDAHVHTVGLARPDRRADAAG